MRKVGIAGLAVAALALAAGAVVASCGQTPTNVPIRTFEGAQKVAVVCLKVRDTNGNQLPSVTPAAQSNCAPVATNVDTAFLPYHLYAAVTQTTRGELALVDLTSGHVVDEDLSTPGINFIPIGTNPTDVAESPDQSSAPAYTFVSSASPTKPALYAVDNTRILGDSTGTASAPLLLTDLRACSLPQQPLALAISSLSSGGGTDGGAAGGLGFRIIALLAGGAGRPATVATVDPSFAQTAVPGTLPPCTILGFTPLSARNIPSTWTPGPAWPDGVPYVDGGVAGLSASEPAIAPANVCASTSVTQVPLPVGLDDAGVLANDAGVVASDAAAGDADVTDAATGDGSPSAEPDGGEEADGGPDAALPLVLGPLLTPSPVSMVLRDDASRLYVADSVLPVIHVLDVSVTPPQELEPILATSLQQPTRQVQVGGLALSPTTRDYKRYLYAIDEPAGSLMVFDVSDPALSPHVPLVRPHAELNPLLPADRLTFASPVATVAFVQHDWAIQLPPNDTVNAYQGLQCNPNPNAYAAMAGTFKDLGAHYRADLASTVRLQGTVQGFPNRLRGIFAFATLTDGTMVTVDVDDWDAPCRRFEPMTDKFRTGELSVPQPDASSPSDFDPYHAPTSVSDNGSPGVTLEPFFPVSAPNRLRSAFLLRNDPTSGVHIPQITQSLSLVDGAGMQQSTALASGSAKPLLLPPALDGFFDPSLDPNPTDPDPASHHPLAPPVTFPVARASDAGAGGANGPAAGVRLAFDDPTVLTNQDWAVTYEGVLPGAQSILVNIAPVVDSASQKLTLMVGGGNLCAVGIEDAVIGKTRAAAALEEMRSKQLLPDTYDGPIDPKTGAPQPIHNPELDLATWTADYVEIVDDLLPSTDAYWGADNSCWDATQGAPVDPKTGVRKTPQAAAADRYTVCTSLFGQYGSNANQVVARDAPILEAYQDHLVTGFYDYPTIKTADGKSVTVQATTSRTIATGASGSSTLPRLMQCCFHSQASVKVRAGGEWIATGNSLGLLHHVKASDDTARDGMSHACVLSCNPNDVLLNARSFDVPWAKPNACTPVVGADPGLDRNNPLAMRNPMLSYVAWSGCGPLAAGDHTLATRDLSWRFSVSGGFIPQTISLSGTSGASVSPQSMLFINSLGSLAVVDGAQQGLVLIDLNTVAFSANYF